MIDTSRLDGRLPNELRPFEVTFDVMGFSLSSLIIRTGSTSVLCSVSIEESVPKWLQHQSQGWLSAEYRLLPGSTPKRQSREIIKLSGRTQEIQRLIGRSLRSVMDLSLLKDKTLLVDCDVIQADAGTRTASITGSWIALHRAISNLMNEGFLKENPIKGQVAAVSVGLLNGIPLLDLDYCEDSKADVDLNVIMDSDGSLLELQGTAEGIPFTRTELNKMLDLAEPAIKQLQVQQINALGSQGSKT
tara:strand:- start:485 stop:1222 length:738 start_codon:yes stop_codon:yes gene_type:complete